MKLSLSLSHVFAGLGKLQHFLQFIRIQAQNRLLMNLRELYQLAYIS